MAFGQVNKNDPLSKYYDVMQRLYEATRTGTANDNVWIPPEQQYDYMPIDKTKLQPTDIENWYAFSPIADGNAVGYQPTQVYLNKKAVEEAYKQTPQGAAEERDRVVAEERARAKQLIDEMDRQQKEREATWLEQQRQAQEKFTAEQARLDAEMKAQQKAFDDARAAKAKAKEVSQVQSAQTQLTALERMGAAKETLVSHDEQTAANVMEEQKTLLEKLLKKGKA